MSQYCLKTVKRLKDIPKKMKADDGTEHSLIEPIHIYLRNLNDATGDALHSFSIVSSPVNQRTESYCSKFVSDRPGWWKSFFHWKLNGVAICFRQKGTTRHLVGLTLCTSYPIFMELQTIWSVSNLRHRQIIDITSAVPSDFSDEFGEFVGTLTNESNTEMPHDVSSAFDLNSYLLSKIDEFN